MKRAWVRALGLLLLAGGLWAGGYRFDRSVRVEGAHYFAPAASSERFAAFGYVAKAKPTPEEVAREGRRLQKILDRALEREYGGWKGYEEAMEKAGEEAAGRAGEAPAWARALMPPSLVKEAVPLLMKGALRWALAHPGARREPFGDLGETGVVLLDREGRAKKIPLGVNQPVVSLAFSPDGTHLAALCDMSTEDGNGTLHTAAKIAWIDIEKGTVERWWAFANAGDELHFADGGKRLAFLVRNPKNREEMAIRFVDPESGRLQKGAILFQGGDFSGLIRGRTFHLPHFLPFDRGRGLALYDVREKAVVCYDTRKLRRTGTLRGAGPRFAVAARHPWLFETDRGRLHDCAKGADLLDMGLTPDPPHGLVAARFLHRDRAVVAVDWMGRLTRLETATGRRRTASPKIEERAGLFFPTPDGKTLVSFVEGKGGFVRYGPLRRKPLELRLYDADSLRFLGRILPPEGTVVDAAAAGGRLFAGGFDTIAIYKKE
ncbi:hypothetical protein [Hydrogenimonas sp.]